MQLLIPISEISKIKKRVPCKCKKCGGIFYITKSLVRRAIKGTKTADFCSKKCSYAFHNKKEEKKCMTCSKIFLKKACESTKSPNHFCSLSCSATYNNQHKKFGTRISKLEKWLKERLTETFPSLEILYNNKETINSELDIYIPCLKLAFELNGIFHYEPIYGAQKLSQIQNNDKRKFQACLEKDIELCIIDTSAQKYVKPSTSQKYLDIVKSIIELKIRSIARNRTE